VTERELRDAIIGAARAAGWAVHYTPKVPVKFPGQPVRWTTPIGGDGKGWLDLTMLRERILPVEIKARSQDAGYHVTAEQQQWIDRWAVVGVRAFIWTPRDWQDGTIDRELTRHDRQHRIVSLDRREQYEAEGSVAPTDPYLWESGT